MISKLLFDKMNEDLVCIFERKSPVPTAKTNSFMGSKRSLDERFERYLYVLQKLEIFLSQAKSDNDEIAMQSILFRLRAQAMGLSSFFDAIVKEAENVLRLDTWPEIPEGYELPKHYQDPD